MGLLDMIFGGTVPQQPPNAPPKQSTADAVQNLKNRQGYLQHQMQMQEQGLTPLTYEQWVAQQAKQQPQR